MNHCDGMLVMAATTGGHLVQLHELADRLPHRGPRLWVTFDSDQARTLLCGERTAFIPYIAERDSAGILRALPYARRILTGNGRISAVVSTGSAIALAFLPYAAAIGIPAHYIESAARVGRPSLTGRLLTAVPRVRLYRQYLHSANGRWAYGGSVFDGFEPVEVPPRPVRRVVVTLGTMAQGFRRLLERLTAIIPAGVEVLWQTGLTPTDGLAIQPRGLVSAADLTAAIRQADAVVAHAGCGSALTALKAGKCPVLVPRNPGKNEVIDAHQAELAAWLSAKRLAFSRKAETLAFSDLQRASEREILRAPALPSFRLGA